jgi:adenylate cyclase
MTEIERKFLVAGDGWGPAADGVLQRQGYLLAEERATVRVRIAAGRATLTVKGPQRGLARAEFEYEIPVEDAEEILRLCPFRVEKTRHERSFGGRLFEIDVFHGENEGLVLAEVELAGENDPVALPPWVGKEVSHDPRFRAAYLARRPFRRWRDAP